MNYLDLFLDLSSRYNTASQRKLFEALPVATSTDEIAYHTALIKLPKWAEDIGLGKPSSIAVPKHCISQIDKPNEWLKVDWYRAVFDMATCQSEYKYERRHGPIHSYAYKLPKEVYSQFQHAWVNRIILFLMRWAARTSWKSEEELFGKKPSGMIHLTHDVDYVSKTLALRFKQSAFSLFNLLRRLMKGDLKAACQNSARFLRFGLGPGNYWQFPYIVDMEAEYGMVSIWNLYAGKGGFRRSVSELILDPAYRVNSSSISKQIRELKAAGHQVGLHQGFHSWRDFKRMLAEKQRLEESLGEPITACRQHWLRFSFADTWKAQEAAGFQLDTTLGFNERPGFRNSAALRMPAWIASEGRFSAKLEILPMVLMDSHLFDYGQMGMEERQELIDKLLDEIKLTGGEATVIWHQRVFHGDYGWGGEYEYLLQGIKKRGLLTYDARYSLD